jgi:SNF2 family DNA or RNA helicase
LADEGHRALVFSQFTSYLKIIRQDLEQAGLECVDLDGSTRDRGRVLESFRAGQAPVFLISLKAGGTGLTLTEADYVFVMDPWWNPAVEAQAVDRAHRIGQTKQVMVYRMVSEGTIEEKVMALKERKAALFDQVIGDGSAMEASFITDDDIRGLME